MAVGSFLFQKEQIKDIIIHAPGAVSFIAARASTPLTHVAVGTEQMLAWAFQP
jgi:MinD-like ATPase involved in chromosome partitioning or flagellar assembly